MSFTFNFVCTGEVFFSFVYILFVYCICKKKKVVFSVFQNVRIHVHLLWMAMQSCDLMYLIM